MITSSNFFRKSFFQLESQANQERLPRIRKDQIAPWSVSEDISSLRPPPLSVDTQPFVHKKPTLLYSNLLPQRKSIKILTLVPKKSYTISPIHRSNGLADRQKGSLRSQNSVNEVPIGRKQSLQKQVEEMSIRQYFSNKKNEQSAEDQLHNKSIAIIRSSLQSNFLVRRRINRKSRYINEGLDCDSKSPLKLQERKQTISISYEPRNQHGSAFQKYKPLKSNRYKL